MITEDLLAYIQAQLKKNISKAIITSRLANAGWHADDIEEGFAKLALVTAPVSSPVVTSLSQPQVQTEEKKTIDPYRELPDADLNLSVSKSTAPVIAPTTTPIVLPEIREIPKIFIPTAAPVVEEKKIEIPKIVFGPQNVVMPTSPKPAASVVPVVTVGPIIPSSPVIHTAEAPSVSVVANAAASVVLEKKPEESTPLIPTLIPKVQPVAPVPVVTVTTSVPVQAPIASPGVQVATPASGVVLGPNSFAPAREPISQLAPKMTAPATAQAVSTTSPEMTLPKSAIISSYAKDFSEAAQANDIVFQKKKTTLLKWLVLILIITLIGGGAFAYFQGLIEIPNFNKLRISLVKKDPKDVLLGSAASFSTLKSYKSDTTASISSPSFANITSGLISGEATKSNDVDSISLSMKGLKSKNDTASPLSSYVMTFKSSLLEKNIVVDMKHGGTTSYVTIPNTEELFGALAPAPAIVAVPDGKFGLILDEFPPAITDKIRLIDTYKVISNGISSSMESELASIFKEFLTTTTVAEKEVEDVRGIPSYHYKINADRATTKKMLGHLLETFTTTLPETTKNTLTEALGSATLDSFDVWIGKEDSMIHKYSIALTVPLSKVLGLDDKGIAGNTVKFSWQTTYYDFDVTNSIVRPKISVPIVDFVKSIRDTKIRATLASFKAQALVFSHAAGNYGSRANPTGSCTNPNPSSLFSPVGHPKGANTAVGAIAGTMNTLLNATNGAGSCYSTGTAWAIASPLASNPQSYFCVDSSGFAKSTAIPLAGIACK